MSMPVVTPAEVQTLPSTTKMRVGSTVTRGNSARQPIAARPVRRHPLAVEQAGRGEHEGAGADRAVAARARRDLHSQRRTPRDHRGLQPARAAGDQQRVGLAADLPAAAGPRPSWRDDQPPSATRCAGRRPAARAASLAAPTRRPGPVTSSSWQPRKRGWSSRVIGRKYTLFVISAKGSLRIMSSGIRSINIGSCFTPTSPSSTQPARPRSSPARRAPPCT